jgi:hypothetical protein
MKIVLGASAEARGYAARILRSLIGKESRQLQIAKLEQNCLPTHEWDFLEHFENIAKTYKKYPEVEIWETPTKTQPENPVEPSINQLISGQFYECFILIEIPVEALMKEQGIAEDLAKLRLYEEKEMAIMTSEKMKVPLFIFTKTDEDSDLKKISSFIKSLTIQSDEFNLVEPDLAQEIQCSTVEVNQEFQDELKEYLEEVVGKFRVHVSWETWKGVYVTPPVDESRWDKSEYTTIRDLLKSHPMVIKTDIPEPGLSGMRKSTA